MVIVFPAKVIHGVFLAAKRGVIDALLALPDRPYALYSVLRPNQALTRPITLTAPTLKIVYQGQIRR